MPRLSPPNKLDVVQVRELRSGEGRHLREALAGSFARI